MRLYEAKGDAAKAAEWNKIRAEAEEVLGKPKAKQTAADRGVEFVRITLCNLRGTSKSPSCLAMRALKRPKSELLASHLSRLLFFSIPAPLCGSQSTFTFLVILPPISGSKG